MFFLVVRELYIYIFFLQDAGEATVWIFKRVIACNVFNTSPSNSLIGELQPIVESKMRISKFMSVGNKAGVNLFQQCGC
jgi:hypothetical protein